MAAVQLTDEHLVASLSDGRSLSVPLNWYPRLLLGEGYAIEWPDLDEHIGVEGLLAGRRSCESTHSFERWLAARRPEA